MNRVFITGVGVISPLGNSWTTFEKNMFEGRSGISGIRGKVVAENFPVPYAGVVDDRGLPSGMDLGLPSDLQTNGARYSLLSTMQCLEKLPSSDVIDAVVYGTAGGVHFEMVIDTFQEFDAQKFPFERARAEFGMHEICRVLEVRQSKSIEKRNQITMNSACASGNHAVGLAFQHIRSGRWKRALVNVVDSGAWPSQIMNFYLLHALTSADVPPEKASCPFSLKRSGFVKSEASASLLIESEVSARARGAEIFGEVKGFGLTSDAYRITDGREDGLCVGRAMEDAVRSAGLELEQIDYINAHGTSTPLNDRLETQAIKNVFGKKAYQIPVSSLKSQVGHSTVAAGGLETIACLSMLKEQKLAPTINYDEPDPECDLDYVPNVARETRVNYILSNNLGFGGQNASLVFGKV
jgi:3-oxoacyl-[acyl-carrier-protein] synthase II